jgi:PAS domain S-box-containing protein
LNPIPAAITTVKDSTITEVNEAFIKLSGYRREDIIGRTTIDINLWSDPDFRTKLVQDILETGAVRQWEASMLDASGMAHDCLLFAEIIDYGGDPKILTMAVDMTEQKRARESLLAAELRYKTLVDNSLNAVTLYRAKGDGEDFEIIEFNKAAERINNMSKDEVVGKSFLDVFPGMRESSFFDVMRRVWKTGNPEYVPVTHYQDTDVSIWRESFVFKLPSGEIVTVHADHTARKKAEEDLQKQRRELFTLFGNLPGMVYRCRNDPDWTMEFVSEGSFALTGYTADELTGNRRISYGQIIHPDDQNTVWNEVQRAIEQKEHFQLIYRIITETGSVKWVWEQGIGVFSPEGDLFSIEGFIVDITKHKQIQEELKKSEERFSKIFRTSPDWVMVTTMDTGVFLEVNEAFLRGTGYSQEEVIGRTVLEINFWESAEDRRRLVDKTRKQGGIRNEEVRFRTKKGAVKTILWSAEIMDFGGRECILGVARDITQYKYLESELHRAQKMESLGRLAGSIAHDFNNLLTAVDGFCDLILLKIENKESVANYIKRIKDVRSSASSFIKQLLSFSRKLPVKPAPVDLNRVVVDMQDLLVPVMGEKIDLRLVLDQRGCPVLADRSQLEQVIMNLSINARDAMPRGGTFTLATSDVHVDEASAESYADLKPGDYVRMIVTDTGTGMDEETASHIFEPFFTTKEDSKGVGLGLTTVYTVVKQTGGNIQLHTEPGKGTTFTIFLPCLQEAGAVTGTGSRGHESTTGRRPE